MSFDTKDAEILRGWLSERREAISPWISALLDDHAQQQAELSRMRTALEELIACKDLKDAIDNNDSDGIDRTFAELDDMVKDYERRKPLAWKAARAAIAERALAPEERALTAGSGL